MQRLYPALFALVASTMFAVEEPVTDATEEVVTTEVVADAEEDAVEAETACEECAQ